jgi:hypothetical protein
LEKDFFNNFQHILCDYLKLLGEFFKENFIHKNVNYCSLWLNFFFNLNTDKFEIIESFFWLTLPSHPIEAFAINSKSYVGDNPRNTYLIVQKSKNANTKFTSLNFCAFQL